ncbi:hypothetical protein BBJ28_00016824 [Nothophytophthora sp. Chile5]|nr:hypothetical protein BBJ28_00016824 [Nothophytophthora sp. Chile5]
MNRLLQRFVVDPSAPPSTPPTRPTSAPSGPPPVAFPPYPRAFSHSGAQQEGGAAVNGHRMAAPPPHMSRPPIPSPPRSSGGSYHGSNRGSYQRASPNGPYFYQAQPPQPQPHWQQQQRPQQGSAGGLEEIPLSSRSTGGVYETVDLNDSSSQQPPRPQQRLFTPPVSSSPPAPRSHEGHGFGYGAPRSHTTATPPASGSSSVGKNDGGFHPSQSLPPTASFFQSQHQQPPTSTGSTASAADLFASGPPLAKNPFAGSPSGNGNNPYRRQTPPTNDMFTASSGGSSANPFGSEASPAKDPFAASPSSGTNGSMFGSQAVPPNDPFAAPRSEGGMNAFGSETAAINTSNPFAASAPANNGFEPRAQPQEHQVQPATSETSSPFAAASQSSDPFASSAPTNGGHHRVASADSLFASPAPTYNDGQWAQAQQAPSPVQAHDLFSEPAPSASSLFGSDGPPGSQTSISASPVEPEASIFASPVKPPLTVFASPVKSEDQLSTSLSSMKVSNPAKSPMKSPGRTGVDVRHVYNTKIPMAKREDDAVSLAPSRMSMMSTLDDSLKLSDMYKQMTDRLEGEKRDLLKVVASQAEQMVQMQQHIKSLEQQLKRYRSQHMSHCYPPNTTHAPGPSAQSSTKGDPFQVPSYTFHTTRGSPGKTRSEQYAPDSGLSPSKLRGRPDRKRPPTAQKDSDQSLLEMLTSTVACLKQKNMDLEALGCLEQSLWLKRRMFGVDNSVVHKALNEVMLSYNSVAMQYLSQGQFDQCLAMLRKAEAVTAPGNFRKCQALQILTFNNIGCCYRKLGKLKSALKYLKEAAQLGSGSTHVKNLSITHLNLCAIQSQLGRHDLALEHAQAAIFHTQEELVSLEDRADDDREEEAAESEGGEQAGLMDALDAKTREEKIISLAVAYHNLAVELEFNGRGEASLQWYKKALQLVWKYRETNEALCESFKKIFLDAKKKQQTANVRQNGIPSFTSTPVNGSSTRRPIARPKSAHPSSRNPADDASRTDVSYSSTVASQCYKATKPSTAGLRYGSPRNSTAPRGSKHQRPASATARTRPMSAMSSVRSSRQAQGHTQRESAVDLHWKKLEKEHSLSDFRSSSPTAAKPERRAQRPQSAGGATAGARRRNPTVVESQRRQRLQGQLYFAGRDDDLMENDEDYGVAVDDGDSDDDLDAFSTALQSDCSSNQSEGKGDSSARNQPRDGKTLRAGAAGSRRHRKVLDDARAQAPSGQSEAGRDSDSGVSSSPRPEESSPSSCQTGYHGDNDADTDVDLPAQRVSHMEYLRRMRKLAESIKDDLNGVNAPPNSTKPAQFAASQARNSPQRMAETNEAADACSPKLTTPRSATCKVRDRLEQVRRDSWGNLQQTEQGGDAAEQLSPAVTAAKSRDEADDGGVEIQEDANVFGSKVDVCAGERRLFHAAAGRRLQAFFRGERCRVEIKLEGDSAKRIQRQVRRHLRTLRNEQRREEERAQLQLQREEVEHMAACLIQHLYRRSFHRHGTEWEEEELPSFYPPIADAALRGTDVVSAAIHHTNSETPCRNSAALTPRLDSNHAEEVETPRQLPAGGTPRRNSAATCIQASMKSFAVRYRAAQEHASHLSRLYIERKHFNVALDHASSGFSPTSSVEKLTEEEHPESEHKDQTLGINYSFLPSSVRALCLSSGRQEHPKRAIGQRHAKDIAEMGLTFSDFLREFETCTDEVLGSSALDAMRILLATSPESTKTLANAVKVAQVLDRRLRDGFWGEAIEASSVALLQEFRDVLDSQ